MKAQKIIIKDPLYKQILLDPKHKKIIDSPYFQRLRYIKQTSFVDLVYPNANHTRFSHSLGTYHLMKKALSNGLNEVDKKEQENLLLAGLLHDIGHGPFSHTWEKIFPSFDHEKTTMQILKDNKLDDVAKILEKKHPYWQLISSTIDVDKLDYMARDSYFAGVSYGVAEVDFIIQHTYVKDDKIVIRPSALSSVEDLITQRVNLFKTVYYHKIAVEYDFLFKKIFERVGEILKNKTEELHVNRHMRAFFEKTNTLENHQALNDAIVIAHITEWSEAKDKILNDLCNRFLSRTKFKVVNLEHKKINVSKIKKEVSKKYDLKYYFGHIKLPITIIQTPIYVEMEGKLKKLEEVSDLIKFYKKQNWVVELVIYPKDISLN